MENQKSNKTKIIISVSISLFLLLAVFGWWLLKTNSKMSNQSKTEVTTDAQKDQVEIEKVRELPKGKMSFVADKSVYSIGDTITIKVMTDSALLPLVGYDVLLSQNPNITFVDFTSMLSDFDAIKSVSTSDILLTVAKHLDALRPTTLKGEVIATITYKASKVGSVDLKPEFVPFATTDSNLMDDKSTDLLGEVKGVMFEIK